MEKRYYLVSLSVKDGFRKIENIKSLRRFTGCSLTTGKEIIEGPCHFTIVLSADRFAAMMLDYFNRSDEDATYFAFYIDQVKEYVPQVQPPIFD